MSNPIANDQDHILAHTEGLWEELRGKRIFITGGSGIPEVKGEEIDKRFE